MLVHRPGRGAGTARLLRRRGRPRRRSAPRCRARAGHDRLRRHHPGLQHRRRLVRRPRRSERTRGRRGALRHDAPRRPRRSRVSGSPARGSRSTTSRPTCSRSSSRSWRGSRPEPPSTRPGGGCSASASGSASRSSSETLERLGDDGPAPFYRGDIAAAIAVAVEGEGGTVGRADLSRLRDRDPRARSRRVRAAARSSPIRRRPPEAS